MSSLIVGGVIGLLSIVLTERSMFHLFKVRQKIDGIIQEVAPR